MAERPGRPRLRSPREQRLPARAVNGQSASFVNEAVFSHPSKVDLVARTTRLGYLVHLHVVMVLISLPVARVAARVAGGGHDSPDQKVRDRYARLWPW